MMAQSGSASPHVVVQTDLGYFEMVVVTVGAPVRSANFLKYVDGRHFDGGTFHRTV